jgi:transposase-like protein
MEVSRSGFYEWRDKPESETAKRRGIIALAVRKSFGESDGTYGYRRVHADLAAWGVAAGPELVRSVMRELDLVPCQPRPWRFSLTEGDGQEHAIPDLVNRDFTAGAPGEKMVGDITYISTWAGWVYLATVIDCYTKAVIGWAIDDNYKTPLIQRAIEMAARNHSLAAKAIFHTDRGSNYTSGDFARTLKKLDIRHSVGEVPRAFRTVRPLGWTIWKGKNLPRPKKSFSPEFRDEAVKMVIETSRPIAQVAKELGINEGTLGNWVAVYRREHAGEEPPLSVTDRARLREVERENRELKMENDFLKKAAAYFARDHR